eukprot:CAMPEP_0113846406 /NCGR_PEP_ID=MMETSP0372-20130328/1291_1 /TAXON_ID=340204 /ORGANISM="Lankesteria abbotti" /LENGTH=265 /DNA_ID=CAMNT_0000815549 /DNA_START=53 /DNA_END=850 /DNA_ORIENTATION=- /assembly_acc=CAM_ASM_000359
MSLSPSDPNVKKQFDTFKAGVTKEATHILSEKMPQKILYFNKLVSEKSVAAEGDSETAKHFNAWLKFVPDKLPSLLGADDGSSRHNCALQLPAKRLKMDGDNTASKIPPKESVIYTASFPAHPQIYQMCEELKKEVAELIDMVGSVKLFIQLNVPRIEGGNNFGVQIQEEAIQELARVEDVAFSFCSSIVEYFTSRATLAAKIIKYPNVEDYKEALRELDEKKWMSLKIARIEMRNNYATLYDLLSKNWERVVIPRQSDSASMIY